MIRRKKGFAAPGEFLSGFTLIEILVVISIIAILSATIIANMNVTRNRGVRTAGLLTIRSVFPELLQCELDGGHSLSQPVAGQPICTVGQSAGSAAWPGHENDLWPSFSSGWNYGASAGDSHDGTYAMSAVLPSQGPINCSMQTNTCQ